MHLTVVDHPLTAVRLTILRDAATTNTEFRRALDGLSGMLVYEATRTIPTAAVSPPSTDPIAPPVRAAARVWVPAGSTASAPATSSAQVGQITLIEPWGKPASTRWCTARSAWA